LTIRIRPATPVPAEATAFARLANMASHDILADVIGPGYEQRLISRFLRDDMLYSYRQVWFVEDNDGIVAMLHAFTGRQKATLPEETEQERALTRPEAAVLVQWQLQPVFDFIDTVPEEAFYVQFLAVNPPARGNGYAGKLIAHAESLARETGSATLELDVEIDNAAALKAYLGQGLEIARTSPAVRYDRQQRSLAMHRMVKVIG